jgi:glutamate racemase
MRSCKTYGMLRRQIGLFDSANEGITILRNVIKYLPVDTAQHLGRLES